MNKLKCILILILVSLLYSQEEGERIEFISGNPFSFFHIMTELENQLPQTVHGILRFPDGEDQKNLPLVIGVAGSLGWGEHNYDYMKMYREMGIATFELKSFASRGVKSTVGEQISVTTAMMVLDAYRALEVLSKDDRIDGERVALTGWSLGGGVTLFSAWNPLKSAITDEMSFVAHLAFYPPCFIQPEILDFTKEPIHILIGELDNWTPADACAEMVPAMQATGANIELTVFENSHHSFDRSSPPTIDENGYSFTNCRLTVREDGAVLMNLLDIPMNSPLLQKIGLAFCAERGPSYGGNPEARKAAFEIAKSFMKNNLLNDE